MKNVILPFISATCLVCLLITPTQGTLVVSNLEQAPVGNAQIASDSWIAQAFFFRASAASLYRLDSVQLRMDSASGVPGNFVVSLYSAPVIAGVEAAPQQFLGLLDGPSDPSTTGVYNYAGTGIELSPSVLYFVVAASSIPIAQGAYSWSAADNGAQDGTWVIPSNWSYTSSDGLAWEPRIQEEAFQVAIHATLVPEPSTLCLAGVGFGFLLLVRRSARQAHAATQ